jgi:hypothetical protein
MGGAVNIGRDELLLIRFGNDHIPWKNVHEQELIPTE